MTIRGPFPEPSTGAPMPRISREDSRAITREQLRNAALVEFAAHGFGGTSIDRITQHAGFSRGAFYANYRTKQDLLLELLEEYNRRELDAWQALLQDQHSLEEIYQRMAG